MRKTDASWSQAIDQRFAAMVSLRRDFHRHPELSFEERRTAEIIAERLHAAKLEVRTGIAGTGVVGILHGDRPGRTVAWRADCTALPLDGCFLANRCVRAPPMPRRSRSFTSWECSVCAVFR